MNFKISLSFFSKIIIISLFSILPFWEVITTQLGYFLGNKEFFSLLRYGLKFVLISILIISVLKKIKLNQNIRYFELILFLFFIFFLVHFIGETGIELIIDGLRLELIYFFISFLIITSYNPMNADSILPEFKWIVFIIIIQGALVVLFGFWQIIDIEILNILYRQEFSQLGNIKLAIGYRVISLMINPINFGSFLIIFWISLNYYLSLKKKTLFKIIFIIFTIICLILIITSLSRLALLSFLIVFGLIFFHSYSKKVILILFLFIAISGFLVYDIYFIDYGYLLKRFSSLGSSSEYTSDGRAHNWNVVINQLNWIDYIWGKGIGKSSPDFEIVKKYDAFMVENAFISIFIQYGLFGLFIFLCIIFKFFINIFFIKKFDKSLHLFFLGFFVFFIIMSFGNDFQRNLPFVFYFWIFFSYSECLIKKNKWLLL